jgi:hypothetical protein
MWLRHGDSSGMQKATVCVCPISWRITSQLLFCMILHSFSYEVPCCVNLTISIPFLTQKTAVASFPARKQNLFKFCWHLWWICVQPPLWLLFSFNIYKWNSGFITWYLYDVIEKFITIWRYRSKKPRSFFTFCAHSFSIFRTHLEKNMWKHSLTVMISQGTVREVHGNSHEKCHLSQI